MLLELVQHLLVPCRPRAFDLIYAYHPSHSQLQPVPLVWFGLDFFFILVPGLVLIVQFT